MFEIKSENYKDLKVCLKEIAEFIEKLEYITVEGRKIKVKKLLGGDLKFLSMILGINAANSKHPCPWCKWMNPVKAQKDAEKKKLHYKFDNDQEWSIKSSTNGK